MPRLRFSKIGPVLKATLLTFVLLSGSGVASAAGGARVFDVGLPVDRKVPTHGLDLTLVESFWNDHPQHRVIGMCLAILAGNKQSSSGLNIAGLLLQSRDGNLNGMTVSGLGTTASRGSLNGLTVSGLGTVASGGSLNGLTVGGLVANAEGGHARGLSVGGIWNGAGKELNGIHVGGLLQHSGGDANGIAVGGLYTETEGFGRGLRVGGLCNVAEKGAAGLMIGGLSASSGGKMSGTIIGGLWTRVRSLSGVQIGVVNKAHNLEGGVQIGLVNIAPNGYISPWAPIINFGGGGSRSKCTADAESYGRLTGMAIGGGPWASAAGSAQPATSLPERRNLLASMGPCGLRELAATSSDPALRLAASLRLGQADWQKLRAEGTPSGTMLGAMNLLTVPPDPETLLAVARECLASTDQDHEAALVDLLERFGDRRLAELYIQGGQPELAKAARAWALQYNVPVEAPR